MLMQITHNINCSIEPYHEIVLLHVKQQFMASIDKIVRVTSVCDSSPKISSPIQLKSAWINDM